MIDCEKVILIRKCNPYFTLQDFADVFSCSREYIRQILTREGLPTKAIYLKHRRSYGEGGYQWKGDGIKSGAGNRRARQLMPTPICELCGSVKNVDIHHRDKNPINNQIFNLQPLCRHCHIIAEPRWPNQKRKIAINLP